MWSSFTIVSRDPPTVVRDRLAAALTSASPGWFPEAITFRGDVYHSGFRVVRNLARMERGMPIVATGQFYIAKGGTVIRVITYLPGTATFALCWWSVFCIVMLWQRLVSNPRPGGIHWGEIAVYVGSMAFLFTMGFVGLLMETRRYQQVLNEIVRHDVS